MINRKNCLLLFIAVATFGCAAPKPPDLVMAPEPPDEWKVIVERKSLCPNISGVYELTPTVAVFQKDVTWQFSIGKAFDFIVLLPFDRTTALKQNPDETSSTLSSNELLFESSPQGDTLWITNPVGNSKSFETHLLKKTENDYKCENGDLVFPEFVIHGGSEGSTLSGRIHRQASKTLSGDLLFYEQVRGYKTVHKYYLFKLKDS